MKTANNDISYLVIGCAMEVHRELGPGLDEQFYHRMVSEKLTTAGVEHVVKPRIPLMHRGFQADLFEPDLIVQGRLVPELKVLRSEFPPASWLQLISYLKVLRIRLGLLLDFGKPSLIQRRVVYDALPLHESILRPWNDIPDWVGDPSALAAAQEATTRVVQAHGLGYRDTTWRSLLATELRASGVQIEVGPMAEVRDRGGVALGSSPMPCLVLNQVCAVGVSALHDACQSIDRARLQTCLRHLGLPWGLLLDFGRTRVSHQFVQAPTKRSGRRF